MRTRLYSRFTIDPENADAVSLAVLLREREGEAKDSPTRSSGEGMSKKATQLEGVP